MASTRVPLLDEKTRNRVKALKAQGVGKHDLALRFGVSTATIEKIVRGKYDGIPDKPRPDRSCR